MNCLSKHLFQKEEDRDENNGESDESLLEKMIEVAKKEVTKGKIEEKRREREANIEEVISVAHLQEKLSQMEERNNLLQKQLDEAKIEIATVKSRNKMLCNILGHGESNNFPLKS